ncbi:MAG: hypothetical protein JO159_00430 [Acidobacteria bacterium]|nr:hypothetical protein [Acidobacteriota bacterium]
MTRTAPRSATNNSEAESRTIATSGEIFADGSVIELVAAVRDDKPGLLFWNGQDATVAPQVEYGGRIYRAVDVEPSILEATRFPGVPVDYGTTRQLFTELATAFELHLDFSEPEAQRLALWTVASWFSDCLSSPPTLSVCGGAMEGAIRLFRLLHSCCRRPLMMAAVTRAGFLSLPMTLRPTLLVNQPSLPSRLRSLWSESNYRGIVVPGNGGAVIDVTCAKAVFSGMEAAAQPLSDETLHLTLPPPHPELPRLDEQQQADIADYFQPRLLLYRLRHLHEVRICRSVVTELRFPINELASKLAACVQGDPELALGVIPLLQPQDEGALDSCNVDSAIIEILWPRLHPSASGELATKIKISELTELINTYLLSCGEILQYSPVEIGKRLACLGLSRHRRGSGMFLLANRDTIRRIHQLARSLGVGKLVAGCLECQQAQIPGGGASQ